MTSESSVNAVRAALEAYADPYLGETLGAAQAVREVRAAGEGFVRALRSVSRWAATRRS